MKFNPQRIRYLSCAIVLLLANLAVWRAPTARASECPDVEFVFARGSGEELGDRSAVAWEQALRGQLSNTNLSYSFYELGSHEYGGAQYPAVAVSGSLSAIGNLIGAYLSGGASFAFGKSVEAGRAELAAYLAERSAACTATKFVLGGYSQGGMLISTMLDDLDASRILYVATFGDPKLYLPEGKGNYPLACQGKNLSNYRAYVSDCRAYKGVLGAQNPYQPDGYYNKLGTWCNAKDIMCSSGINISDHTAYIDRGLYGNAAKTIRGKLEAAWPEKFPTTVVPEPSATSKHDVAIVIYEGPEMEFVLEPYKAFARGLANRVHSLGGRVALYFYSDSKRSTKTYRACGFDCTNAEIELALEQRSWLVGHTLVNSGLSASMKAMYDLTWQVGANKSIALLSPAPYAPVDNDGTRVEDVAELSLKIDPVNIYPIVANAGMLPFVEELAHATNGAAYTLDDAEDAIANILHRPTVQLDSESYAGRVGDEFNFVATVEADDFNGYTYDWDLDADGEFELLDVGDTVKWTYDGIVTGFIQVRVTDRTGYASTMSAAIAVSEADFSLPEITAASATKLDDDTYEIKFSSTGERVLVVVNDVLYGFYEGGNGRFILGDVNTETVVQLTPVANDIKGDPKTVYLDSAGMGNTTGVGLPVNPQPSAQTTVPKVPNTGVYPKRVS